MQYRPALWDGSEPLYAPGMFRAKKWFYWRPPSRYVKHGYHKATIRLQGEDGDGLDMERAARARELTLDMLRWYQGDDGPQVVPGSWGWLFGRYKSDEFSPIRDVKDNTRENYLWCLSRWEPAIGQTIIKDTDHVALKRLLKTMREKGRSPIYIKRMFTMLRIVVSYGVMIKAPGARDVKDVLGEMRISGGRPRSASPTEDQITAIIDAADADGNTGFALGLSIQWWLTLRAVDVRGQWLGSPKQWRDGLTWDMLDRDLTTLRKTPSKTEKTSPDALVFDLTLLPQIRARLQAIPQDQRVGPVIRAPNGKPYFKDTWAAHFRRYADAAGVPSDIWAMDIRAGAINHAKRSGASHIEMQHAANHTQASTTDRYIREQNASVNNVIKMRIGK